MDEFTKAAQHLYDLARKDGSREVIVNGIAAAIRSTFERGRADQREQDSKLCDHEKAQYLKSAREFDTRGDSRMGTEETRCAVTAQILGELIRGHAKQENPAWQCGGCKYIERFSRHDLHKPCPKCGKTHYWTGSIADADIAAFANQVCIKCGKEGPTRYGGTCSRECEKTHEESTK